MPLASTAGPRATLPPARVRPPACASGRGRRPVRRGRGLSGGAAEPRGALSPLPVVLALALTALGTPSLAAQTTPAAEAPDETLAALAFLAGRWRVPSGDPLLDAHPEAARLVVLEARWVVGGKALRWREHVPVDGPDEAELEGMVYWDPAEERIEFVAVGGRADGQGRLFVGHFIPLDDGRVEKVYDVFYRTLADMPGEELGGSRRRFREVLEPAGPDGLEHTLEWWLDGRWQPYSRGRYRLTRAAENAAGAGGG